MNKRLLSLILIVPLLVCCTKPEPKVEIVGDTIISISAEGEDVDVTFTSNHAWTATSSESWVSIEPASGAASDEPIKITITCDENIERASRSAKVTITADTASATVTVAQEGAISEDTYVEKPAEEVKDGDVVQATNPLMEKFLTEVVYEDRTYKLDTKIFDYYGGFDGVNLTWDNWETDWPDGDKPMAYSIRWKKADMEAGDMTLYLEDDLSWKGEMEVAEGATFVNITNLVPNDRYHFKVTTASGKVLTQGSFSTTGSLHQVFFSGNVRMRNGVVLKGEGARNGRDLGGWKTLDGKTVKYRKVYRGGRLNEKWAPYPLNVKGQKEVLFEGIRAQLDLRGTSDVMFTPAVEGLDHCAPVIEEGGKTMLTGDAAKTKECFEFVVNSLRANKPVYFHCSLGRDRTGTLDILLMGLLGVREGDIAKEFELTYFAPVGYSVSSSDVRTNPIPIFKNTRKQWVYNDVVPYIWNLAGEGTFAQGVEKYLLEVAGVSQQDIDDFRNIMLD